jgi:hypothetical protein
VGYDVKDASANNAERHGPESYVENHSWFTATLGKATRTDPDGECYAGQNEQRIKVHANRP